MFNSMIILYGTKLNSFSWPEGRRAGIARSKITQDVRDYAAKLGVDVREYAAQQGMEVNVVMDEGMKAKAKEFKEGGSEIYKEV